MACSGAGTGGRAAGVAGGRGGAAAGGGAAAAAVAVGAAGARPTRHFRCRRRGLAQFVGQQPVQPGLRQLAAVARGVGAQEFGQPGHAVAAADFVPGGQLALEARLEFGLAGRRAFARLREQHQVLLQGAHLPGHLAPARGQAHVQADALEGVLDAGVGHRQLANQVVRVEPVAALAAVVGDLARRGRVGEQAAGRRVERAQPSQRRPPAAAERVVPAGVEDDQVAAPAARLHAAQQLADVDRLPRHVGCLVDARVHRHQVVAPVELEAVAGVVEDGHAHRVASQAFAEAFDRTLQVLPSHVGLQLDLEARALEQRGHGTGVVVRVGQGLVAIGRIAHHQRDAFGARAAGLPGGGRRPGQQRQQQAQQQRRGPPRTRQGLRWGLHSVTGRRLERGLHGPQNRPDPGIAPSPAWRGAGASAQKAEAA